jgi:hypothetical protein
MVCRSGLGGEQMTTEEAKSAAGYAPQKDVQAVRGVLDLLCHDESLIMRRRAGLTDLFVALDSERKLNYSSPLVEYWEFEMVQSISIEGEKAQNGK